MVKGSTSLRVLSWNVDMDSKPVTDRMLGLIRHVRHFTPDVICLQELTQQSYTIISKALCNNLASSNTNPSPSSSSSTKTLLNSNDEDVQHNNDNEVKTSYVMHCNTEWCDTLPYFCAMLTREKLFSDHVESDAIRFPKSDMYRAYIHVTGKLNNSNGHHISLITSHLESLQTGSDIRKQQLSEILDIQRDMVANDYLTIFAGDTNLRESEVPARQIEKKLVVPTKTTTATRIRKKARTEPKFQDAWVLNGMNNDHKFTWDTSVNDNLDGFTDFKPKARYDRAFVLAPSEIKVSVPQFKLVGKQRTPCGKFISDHWGMLMSICFDSDS